jgi:UDP-N-acetylglucosamine 3-dehydrogenase
MLKAAVVGVGSIGRNHARVYRESTNAELVAVVDEFPETAKQIAHQHHVASYTKIEEMLDKEKPDIVSVAVPTESHLDVAETLIDRGIHVLVEKPIASTLQQARDMIRLAEEKAVVLAVGHIERHNPAVIELVKRLDDGQLGKIFQLHARRIGPFPARIRDVGVLLDLATHDLDVMTSIVRQPVKRVMAETVSGINTDREDMVNGFVRFEDGVLGVIDINWMTPTKIRELTVIGALGMFRVNYLSQELYFYENDVAPSSWDSLSVLRGVGEGNVIGYKLNRVEPLKAEIEDFIKAVNTNGRPRVNGTDGLRALYVALAMVESGNTGVPVTLDDMKDIFS